MIEATLNGITVAKSESTISVEGNHYFPPDSINPVYFKPSDRQTTCPWKGVASYYHIDIEGQVAENAAWYYPTPKDAANEIENYVAFYGNIVTISD